MRQRYRIGKEMYIGLQMRRRAWRQKKYVFQEALLNDGSAESATKNVINDFIDRSIDRNPEVLSPLEEGHRSTCFAYIANIAYKLDKRLEWDANAERFTNCDEANKLLHFSYRAGDQLG